MNLEELITDFSNKRRVFVLQVAIFLISTVPVLVMGYQRYDDQKNNAIRAVFSQEEAAAEVVTLTVNEKFTDLERIGMSLSTRVQFRDDIKRGKWNDAIQKLASVPQDFPEIDRLFITDPYGVLKAEYPPLGGVVGMDFSYRDWYKGVSADWSPYISDVYTRAAEPKIDAIAVSVPIKNDEGGILGILVMQLNIQSVFSWAKDFSYNNSGEGIYFVDRAGSVISGLSQDGTKEVDILADYSIVDEVLMGKGGTKISTALHNKKEYVMSYKPIKDYGWGVISQHSVDDAFLGHRETLRNLMIAIGLVFILNTSIATFVVYMVYVFRNSLSRDASEKLKRAFADQKILKDSIEIEKNQDEAVLNSIGEGMIVTDKNRRIIKVNKLFEKLLGWEENEVLGKDLTEVVTMQDENGRVLPSSERSVSKVLAGAQTIVDTISGSPYYVRRDGTRFPVTTVTTPVKAGGHVIGAVVVFRDVTEDKVVDKAKTDFVSVASHQLRTPLATIRWYSEYLLSNGDKLNDEQKEYFEEIQKSVNRMVMLVNTLLDVSKIEMGKFVIMSVQVNIIDLIHEVLRNFKRDMDRKKITFNLKCDIDNLIAETDPNAVTMIIQNLISNAVAYTPEGGRIGVVADRVGSNVELKVIDNGYGIPDKEKPMIFTRMYRGENVKDKVPDGNGIGLYIAKAVVEKLGGNIRFESQENVGTTFIVNIPLRSKTVGSAILKDSRVDV